MKKIILSTTLVLTIAILAGCVGASTPLPAPYNDLHSLQQKTSNELASASQKMETLTTQPEALVEQASSLDKFIREQKEEIITMAVADAEKIKADTITELETAKQLASSIKTNATKLVEDPSLEKIQKLTIGYISRLKTQSTKIEELQKKLEKQVLPEEYGEEDTEPSYTPTNPDALEATI